MEAELGFFLLILVAVASTCAALLHWSHRATGKKVTLQHEVAISHIISLASTVCLALLIVCFIQDNFSLEYVVTHSNSQLPLVFKIAAAWGGHQGSMLFWVVTLSWWASFIALKSPISARYTGDCLGIMNLLIALFAWFTLATSNPFEYAQILVSEGRDLNPMLQDVGLILHPPLLYLGYVGYSAILAFALAALLNKQPLNEWIEVARGATTFAWSMLTIGILVGSWWAYNELGWGGWWFWDPVENASLLPWLTGTALLHSNVLAKRNNGAIWSTYALAFATFCLSILGTFIVRSGVLTSVHAFAVDPTKGLLLLAVLSVLVFITFGVLILQGEKISRFTLKSLVSRAYTAYIAIGLLVITTAIVFLGTFYPMVYQLLGLGNISVGAPYFNSLVYPLSLLALIVLAVMPILKWTKGWRSVAVTNAGLAFTLSIVVSYGFYLTVEEFRLTTLVTVCLATWVTFSHLLMFYGNADKSKLLPMLLAHIGFALAASGAVFNSDYSYEYSLRVEPGKSYQRGGITINYQGIEWLVSSNYTAERGFVNLHFENGDTIILKPEKRHYPVRVMNMTEPAIRSLWHGDYYVTLGDKIDRDSYAIKVQYKAGIWWIWSGGLLAVFGAFMTLARRNREVVNAFKEYA